MAAFRRRRGLRADRPAQRNCGQDEHGPDCIAERKGHMSNLAQYARVGQAFRISIELSMAGMLITLLATFAPARRASLVDPMRALRDE